MRPTIRTRWAVASALVSCLAAGALALCVGTAVPAAADASVGGASAADASVDGASVDPALAGASGRQVVIVSTPSAASTTATLTAFERTRSGRWVQVLGPTRADVGRRGVIAGDQRRQGRGHTPLGTYRLLWAFGRADDPGTRLRYVRVDGDDVWPYDPRRPATYNLFQPHGSRGTWRAGWREDLRDYRISYRHAVVLDYNLPHGTVTRGHDGLRRTDAPADTRAGGGIFLHVTDGRPTAGCIAIRRQAMVDLLHWLDPGQRPTIVIRLDAGIGGAAESPS